MTETIVTGVIFGIVALIMFVIGVSQLNSNKPVGFYSGEKAPELMTVYASFFPENIASKRIMEKCGMTYSHTNKNEFEYLGKERDLIYYKIEFMR